MSRIKILKIVVFAVFTIIMARLFFIQIIEHNDWVAKANEKHTILETIVAKRGEIYMLDNNEPVPVVLNQTVYSVIIDPAVTDQKSITDVLNELAKDYIVADINEIYNIDGLRYYIVAKNVPHSIATEISERGIASVWFQKNNRRVYPEGEMASGLLGFVNSDGLGQYGVEGSLNNRLAGNDGLLKTISDINNVALSIGNDNVKIPAEDGQNIVLTIDRGLEKGVEEIAMEAINNTAATNASVLIMDPNDGKVIAMADLPNYNPGNYGNVKDASVYVNNITEVPYEPASICKSFTFSAAINEGKMSSETTYYNKGYEIIDGQKIYNAEQRSSLLGEINMRSALYWSLNTGSIYALKLLGDNPDEITQQARERLYDYYYNKFRLGRITGIELIEAEGYIQDPNEGWGRNSTYANMTFGQNLGITMIQTATAFSAVVNGGYYRTPYVVAGAYQDGEIIPDVRDDIIKEQILSESTSTEMREMLINNRNYKVRSGIDRDGYAIGGKSGTAQVVVDGRYDDTMQNLIGSYIGFVGPQNELPKYVIMVKMWAEGEALDGGIAGNLFDSVSNYLIDYLKIKPGN